MDGKQIGRVTAATGRTYRRKGANIVNPRKMLARYLQGCLQELGTVYAQLGKIKQMVRQRYGPKYKATL